MNIILIGPPACGKGTQAKSLCKKFDLVHLSTGDLFREIVSQNSPLANEIKSYIDNGKFVPDELTIKLVENKLSEIDSQKGILFDGFPRTVFQAEMLEKSVKIDYVFEIKISEQSMVKRVLDRGVCLKCGKSFLLSQTNFKCCDVCGGEIGHRKDDTEVIAKNRYQDFMQKTYPILNYFKDHKGYKVIDGELSIDEVFNQICNEITK